MAGSYLETVFKADIEAAGLPSPETQYRFCGGRRWAFDFAWPTARLAVEVEGGLWVGGRHVTPKGFEGDCDKYNTATLLGWRVLRFTADQVKSGAAIATLKMAFGKNLTQALTCATMGAA